MDVRNGRFRATNTSIQMPHFRIPKGTMAAFARDHSVDIGGISLRENEDWIAVACAAGSAGASGHSMRSNPMVLHLHQ
jgi:hypothetical protein